MEISHENIRRFRLSSHHLDKKLPHSQMTDAAGACGMQNSPPGAWETALFCRVEDITLKQAQRALYQEKTLLQAWSFRGAPVVFPTELRDVFLSALMAQKGEDPWIYTMGISGALDFMGMDFDSLLPMVKSAALCLDHMTITGKEELDRTLAQMIEPQLAPDKLALWRAPSVYDPSGRQTMGQAAVSFMLRPCAFDSLVVFGQRQGQSPTFTSLKNWTGLQPKTSETGRLELVRRFLHCWGPADKSAFMSWLGCSRPQADRLWRGVEDELCQVTVDGRRRYALQGDLPDLLKPDAPPDGLLMLGPHDPYLDIRHDRHILLSDTAFQAMVWRTTANPGVLLRHGAIVGVWRSKKTKKAMDITFQHFCPLSPDEKSSAAKLAEGHAAFRGLALGQCTFQQ